MIVNISNTINNNIEFLPRKFINALTKKYGAPSQIVVELARELKLGQKRLREIEKEQSMNRKHNEEIADEIMKLGIENTYQNRLKYKLWKLLLEKMQSSFIRNERNVYKPCI